MRAIILALGLLALSHTALAQVNNAYVLPGGCGTGSFPTGTAQPLTVDSTGKNCVNASVTASVTGFAPSGNYATQTAPSGSSSAATALPAGSPSTIVVFNTGSNTVSFNLGGGGVTATNSNNIIAAGGWMAFAVGTNTNFAVYGIAGSSTVVVSGGSGLATGAVAGSGGSGSNASVSSTGAAVPGSATYLGVSNGGTLTGAPGDATNGIWVNVKSLVNPIIAGGPTASGGSFTANPLPGGGRAQNAENTAVANGQAVAQALDLTGKTITSPFANKENWLAGAANTTGTTATTFTGMGAQGVGVKIYVTGIECSNSAASGTPIVITLNDSAATAFVMQSGYGTNMSFPTPLVVAANTAFTFTPGTGSSTTYCSAQGFKGT